MLHRNGENVYREPPTSLEEHHEEIEDIHTIMQGMQTQIYELEGLVKSNAVITSLNSAVITQLVQMTVIMNNIQAQLNTLASAQTNQARPKRKH